MLVIALFNRLQYLFSFCKGFKTYLFKQNCGESPGLVFGRLSLIPGPSNFVQTSSYTLAWVPITKYLSHPLLSLTASIFYLYLESKELKYLLEGLFYITQR